MAIITNCPACHRDVTVAESLRDQTVRCPGCGGSFMPSGGRPVLEPSAERTRFLTRRRHQRRSKYLSQPLHRQRIRMCRRLFAATSKRTAARDFAIGLLSVIAAVPCGFVGIILGIIAWQMAANDLYKMHGGAMTRTAADHAMGQDLWHHRHLPERCSDRGMFRVLRRPGRVCQH